MYAHTSRAKYRVLLTGFFGIKQQSTTDLEGMIPALDGVVSFNFASATAPKRSENAKRHSIKDQAGAVVVVSFFFFFFFSLKEILAAVAA